MILRGDHCQCGGCGLYFNSTYAFDKHREGKHGNRRCLTTDEMLLAGMTTNATGWWISQARSGADSNSTSGDLLEGAA